MKQLDVMGPAEVAKALGVNRQRFNVLSKREDFPVPGAVLASGTLWYGPDIRAYALDRMDRTLKHQRVLLGYRETGTIAGAARKGEVTEKTAKDWLTAVGAI